MLALKPRNNLHELTIYSRIPILHCTSPYPGVSLLYLYNLSLIISLLPQLSLDCAAAKEAPGNLVRDMDGDAEVLGECPHRAGVLLERPPDEDDVRRILVEHPLRDAAVGDVVDGRDDEPPAERGLDCARVVGVRGLGVARGQRLVGVVARGGDVEHVEPALGKEFGKADGVLQPPRGLVGEDGLQAVGRRDTGRRVGRSSGMRTCGDYSPHEEGHLLGYNGADAFHDLKVQPDAVLEATAVLVRAVVGDRARELVQQVPMGGVDFDHVDAGLDGAGGGVDERLADALDALRRERLGLREALRVANCARPDDVVRPAVLVLGRERVEGQPRRDGGRLAARVGELDGELLVLAVHERRELCERGDVRVGPEPEVFWRDAALWRDGRRLRHRQAWPARGNAAD